MAYAEHYAGKIAGNRERYLVCRIETVSDQFGKGRHATHDDPMRGLPGPSVMAVEGGPDTLKRLRVVEHVVAAMNGGSLQVSARPAGYHWSSAGEGANLNGPFALHKPMQARNPEASLIILEPQDEGIQGMDLPKTLTYLCAMASNVPEVTPPGPKKRGQKRKAGGPLI